MKLTFCDARKCQELTSSSRYLLLLVNKKYHNKSFLSVVKRLFFEKEAIAAGIEKRIYISDTDGRDTNNVFQPTDTCTRRNIMVIESAPSRFRDCKGQVRGDQHEWLWSARWITKLQIARYHRRDLSKERECRWV